MKIERSAFLYLDPKPPKGIHGQCGSCMMWTGPKHNTCTIHGKNVVVKGSMTCGWYVHGDPMPDEAGHEMASVTPKESGLEDRKIRCENCIHFEAEDSECELYDVLNKAYPDMFFLDEHVEPQGCCNANTEEGVPAQKYEDEEEGEKKRYGRMRRNSPIALAVRPRDNLMEAI